MRKARPCIRCQQAPALWHRQICRRCHAQASHVATARYGEAVRAYRVVRKAIRAGQLADLHEHNVGCTDCGARADRYDHRDYRKPLRVDPVCRSCNAKRGPALFDAEAAGQGSATG